MKQPVGSRVFVHCAIFSVWSIVVSGIGLPGGAALPGGGWTPAAGAQTLSVQVLEGQRGEPLAGAFVMVGRAKDDPHAGNVQWTDAQGTAVFTGAWLADPQTVTATCEGYGHTTVYAAALGEIVLPLFPVTVDSTLGGTATRVEGQVLDIAFTNNDGQIDVALVIPAMPMSAYAFQDMAPWIAPNETIFILAQPVVLPSNVYIPRQLEMLFVQIEKSPYWLLLPGGRTTTIVSVAARVPLSVLLEGGDPIAASVVREVGVERDQVISGPTTVNILSDLALSRQMQLHFERVPASVRLTAGSAALIPAGAIWEAVGYDTRYANSDSTTFFELATRAPGGDLADAVNLAVGAYADSSLALAYSTGILTRLPAAPPYSLTLSSWMRLPELDQAGRTFRWSDVTEPGVSPSPTWTRSVLGLRATDPADSTTSTTIHWRLYAAAPPGSFELPVLPPEAPGSMAATGGLPDPADTPESDQLYWSFVAANSSGGIREVLQEFVGEGTHWSQRWVAVDHGSLGTPDPEADPSIGARLSAAPVPGGNEIRLAWAADLPRGGVLETWDAAGRLVASARLAPGCRELRWQGRDSGGRPLPGGVYWVRLSEGGRVLDARRIVRVAP